MWEIPRLVALRYILLRIISLQNKCAHSEVTPNFPGIYNDSDNIVEHEKAVGATVTE